MRRTIFTVVLAVIAACGCIEGLDDGAAAPTLEPMPTAELLPAPPLIPTAEPLPTMPPAPTATPVPPAAGDPIIGTWLWQGANNVVTIYTFNDDGTFERRDRDRNTTLYMGVWVRQGPDTYRLIYNTPTPGIATETVTYHGTVGRLENNQTYYARV